VTAFWRDWGAEPGERLKPISCVIVGTINLSILCVLVNLVILSSKKTNFRLHSQCGIDLGQLCERPENSWKRLDQVGSAGPRVMGVVSDGLFGLVSVTGKYPVGCQAFGVYSS